MKGFCNHVGDIEMPRDDKNTEVCLVLMRLVTYCLFMNQRS